MSRDGCQHKTETASDFGKPDDSLRYAVKTALIRRTNNQWTSIVGFEDGDFFHRVLYHFLKQIIGNDQGQGLSGEVNVLLVLGDVRRDGLVAKLAQLNANFFGCNAVSAIADHRPVTHAHSIGPGQL